MNALIGGGNAILLLLTVLGLGGVALAALLDSRRQNRRLMKPLATAGATVALGYATLVLVASVTSTDQTLAQGKVKWFCGFYIDCHLGVSVERTDTARSLPGPNGPVIAQGIFHIVTLRLHNSARNPNLDMTLYQPVITVRDAEGNAYVRAHTAEATLVKSVKPSPVLNAERKVSHQPEFATVVYDLPDNVKMPSIYVREGWILDRAIEFVLVNDENSIFHGKTLLSLDGGYAKRNTGSSPNPASPQLASALR